MAIAQRELKLFLDAAVVALQNPAVVARLVEVCARNEEVLTEVREAQAELAVEREGHRRRLAVASEEQAERLRCERAAWDRELAAARRELEKERDELERRKAWGEQMRRALERKVAPASGDEIEQQPSAA
jgi:hypothetical protein